MRTIGYQGIRRVGRSIRLHGVMIDSFGGGNGDHKLIDAVERPYPFADAATLLADFWDDVKWATR